MINTAEVGGGGEHLLHLTRELRPLGFDSVVAVGRDGPVAHRLRAAGVRVIVLGPLGVTAPRRIAAVAREVPHSLLHAHGSRAAVASAVAFPRGGPDAVVYTAHAFSFRRRASFAARWAYVRAERFACRRADRVVALTVADARAAAGVGIDTARFAVIPNGIDPSGFDSVSNRRAELRVPAGAQVVGFVGRFVPQKDPDRFVRVAARVAGEIPEARFLMVGDGPLRRAVEAVIRSHGLPDRVILTGYRTDIPELLASMDVVVLTSAWEGLPMVALEAMAARRPVVAPSLPGLDEVIQDGETGVLVSGREPDALAAAAVHLLRDAGRREAFGSAARNLLERKFTAGRMAAATATLYHQVLGTSAAPGAGPGA